MPRLLFLLLIFSFSQSAFAAGSASGHQKEEVSVVKNYACKTTQHQPLFTEYRTDVYHATGLPVDDSTDVARIKRKAKWSRWLGLGSLAGLIIPFVTILSIPAAIVSLILAGQVKRQTTDPNILKDAKSGKQTSIVTLTIIAVSIVVVVVVVAALLYRYR